MSSSSAAGFPSLPFTETSSAAGTAAETGFHSKASDESLLAAVQAGDTDALTCLFRRYSGLARGIGRRILRDDGEAEDLVQDVFLFLYRNSCVFDSSKNKARSWIIQIIYYKAVSRRRYLSSRQFFAQTNHKGRENEAAVPCASHEHSGDALFARIAVAEVLGTLTEDQRETLRLYFFEGRTLNEISAKLNRSLGNVRHHYYRALDRLRKRMLETKSPGR